VKTMDGLNKEELTELVEDRNGQIVSIFLPTEKLGADTQQNPIRLKNLVAEAETRLSEQGLRKPAIQQLLQPVNQLVDDSQFWQHQQHGLAIFCSVDKMRWYRSPVNFTERVVIAQRPYLKPLLRLIRVEGRFYVLALSQNQVKLWQGSADGLQEVKVNNMPSSLNEALRYDDPEKQQQFHTSTATPMGGKKRSAMFHGHGAGRDNDSDLARYFRQIDGSLRAFLQDETAPLVLAGVDYLFPIYQEVNTYPHLVEKNISGNPEVIKSGQLHQQAMAVLRPRFDQTRQMALEEYHNLLDTDQASTDIRQIVPAAYYGRVKTLFLARGHEQWGRFDPDTDTLELQAGVEPDNEDLLDAVAIQTFLKNGEVYVLEKADMPGGAPMAAVLRYSLQ
jgi:hypothetical protein